MGTTLSNMQILGAEEDAVRAALPGALVGRWSERFVTACPQMSRRRSSAPASSLSARLSCTVLLVEMFDGDALWLTLFQAGKKLTALRSLPPPWSASAGSPKLFCAALGLPEELAPQLRRFFTGCSMQEEKLAILQSLLGAPLFLRWDSPPPEEAVPADAAPLLQWIADHPLPPKIKNQRRAELLQEIPDRYLEPGLILRPAVHKDGPHPGCYAVQQAGDILGYAKRGGERCRPLPDGRLELLPLADPPIPRELPAGVSPEKAPPAGEDGIVPLHYDYAFGGDRLVTLTPLYLGGGSPYCTAILHDTAGLLSPRVLTLDGEPVNGTLSLLPDGGFLAGIAPRFDGSRPSRPGGPPWRATTGREISSGQCGARGTRWALWTASSTPSPAVAARNSCWPSAWTAPSPPAVPSPSPAPASRPISSAASPSCWRRGDTGRTPCSAALPPICAPTARSASPS